MVLLDDRPLRIAGDAVHRLGPSDGSLITRRFAECADFFELIHAAAEAAQILSDVPRGKQPGAKLVFRDLRARR